MIRDPSLLTAAGSPARTARSVDRIRPDWFVGLVVGQFRTDQDKQ